MASLVRMSIHLCAMFNLFSHHNWEGEQLGEEPHSQSQQNSQTLRGSGAGAGSRGASESVPDSRDRGPSKSEPDFKWEGHQGNHRREGVHWACHKGEAP